MNILQPESRTKNKAILQPDQVEQSIVVVRGLKVLLDEQLAGFYGVEPLIYPLYCGCGTKRGRVARSHGHFAIEFAESTR